jgi:hypothetical protein
VTTDEVRHAGPPKHESSSRLHGEEEETEGVLTSRILGWRGGGVSQAMKGIDGGGWSSLGASLGRGKRSFGGKNGCEVER